MSARLAQSVEHQTFNLRVEGSSPSLGADILYSIVETPTMVMSSNTMWDSNLRFIE